MDARCIERSLSEMWTRGREVGGGGGGAKHITEIYDVFLHYIHCQTTVNLFL